MKKSERTKSRLLEVALKVISQKGFEEATLRGIAKEAGVAPGGIYYYFESKESFIYEYYKQSNKDHVESLGDFFQKEKSFSKRLHFFVTQKIKVANPYKDMSRALFRVAADPNSPMSPFSKESLELRREVLDLLEELLDGSDAKFLPEIRDVLPEYLWLYMMGLILFWIYDTSEESKRTFELIDKTIPLIEMANTMIQSPMALPFRKNILLILKSFVPNLGRVSNS